MYAFSAPDGLLTANIPTKPPREVQKRSKPTPNSGPTSASDFEVFVEPVIEEYLAALPVRKTRCCGLLSDKERSFYQDRLGTNERKTQKTPSIVQASGAAVTLVLNGEVVYCKGVGATANLFFFSFFLSHVLLLLKRRVFAR